MKITISLAEVKLLLAAKIGVPANTFEVEVDAGADRLANILAELNAIAPLVNVGNKIAAVKDLRENVFTKYKVNYSLWEAKTIVENLESAKESAKRSSDWPRPVKNGDYGSFNWER